MNASESLSKGVAFYSAEESVHNMCKGRSEPKKKHVCAKCGAGFTRACDLKVHLRKHSKPFKCTICDVTFIKRDSLGRHMAKQHRHTELEVYVHCSLCQKKYRRKADLRKHMKLDHQVVLENSKRGARSKKSTRNAKASENHDDRRLPNSLNQPWCNSGLLPELKQLDHNTKSILKYLMQKSPIKADCSEVSSTKTCSSASKSTFDIVNKSLNNFSPGHIHVKTVQIDTDGPFLDRKLSENHNPLVSECDKVLNSSENKFSLSEVCGNFTKGITVTPFHVHKSPPSDNMLPFEQGFSISESKRYSLNFGVNPDPQLPENFMAESPENSLEGRISPLKTGYTRVKTPTLNLKGYETLNSTSDASKESATDVITIDSDSNLSDKLQSLESDSEVSKDSEESDTDTTSPSHEEDIYAKNATKEKTLNKRKRRLFSTTATDAAAQRSSKDSDSGVSIVTYQAVSPAKVPRTSTPVEENSTIGRKLSMNSAEKTLSSQPMDCTVSPLKFPGTSSIEDRKSLAHDLENSSCDGRVDRDESDTSPSVKQSAGGRKEKLNGFDGLVGRRKTSTSGLVNLRIADRVSKKPMSTLKANSSVKAHKNSTPEGIKNNIKKVKTVCLSSKSKTSGTTHSINAKPCVMSKRKSNSNISVKEVILDNSGPSLFGKINRKQPSNGEMRKKVLVIKSHSDISVKKKPQITEVVKVRTDEEIAMTKSNENSTSDKGNATQKENQSSVNSEDVDEMDSSKLNSFYHSQEVKQTLRSIVTQPFASELLRAKREKLTIDDIYEEKIAKLLDKIGVNTFKGIPISQYFSGSDSVPNKSHVNKSKILGNTNVKSSNNGRDLKSLDPTQRAQHQEHVRARVAAFIAMLEKNKKAKKPFYSTGKSPPTAVSETLNNNCSNQHLLVTKQNNNIAMKQLLPDNNKSGQNEKDSKAGTVFDGVFKVPTKCAPSIHGGKTVKVVLRNNPTVPVHTVSSIPVSTIQTEPHVFIPKQVNGLVPAVNLSHVLQGDCRYKPVKLSMAPTSLNTSGRVVMSPCVSAVVLNSTQPQVKVSEPVTLSAFVPCASSSSTGPLLMEDRVSTVPFNCPVTVVTTPQIANGEVKSSESSSRGFTAIEAVDGLRDDMEGSDHKVDELDSGISGCIKNTTANVISPKSDSQQSLPDMDFFSSLSGGCFKHSMVSPTKLINGNSCSSENSVSPIKDISPGKDGSLFTNLTIQDMNPMDLQALMTSPIKSFDMDNSNLSTASQNELLETLQNFLKDVPRGTPLLHFDGNSCSPQKSPSPVDSSTPESGKNKARDRENIPFSEITDSISKSCCKEPSSISSSPTLNLNTIFSTSPVNGLSLDTVCCAINLNNIFSQSEAASINHDLPESSDDPKAEALSGSKFFNNLTNSVQVSISQPCRTVSMIPSPTEFVTSPSHQSKYQHLPGESDASHDICDEMNAVFRVEENCSPEKLDQKSDPGSDYCDMNYVSKPLVVNAPELHDENTMDRIVSVVEDLKALGQQKC